MTFAAPLWLLGLLPWAGVALYLLWGRRRREAVPFLDLWLGPVTGPKARRRLAAPPLAIALGLLAMLLALLGAAQPHLSHGSSTPRLTILVDRGASMSALAGQVPRFVETAEAVEAELQKAGARPSVTLHLVPGAEPVSTTASKWLELVRRAPRTAVGTRAALAATLNSLRDAGDVVVITDQPPANLDARFVAALPTTRAVNVGLKLVSVRELPRPQVMVRIGNDSPARPARLEIVTAGRTTSTTVELPGPGEPPRDAFVDVPALGDLVEVRLGTEDSFDGDNAAWLVREGSWPRIEPRAALSAELARMVEVYGRSRPAGEESARVAIVDDPAALTASSPGVVIAPESNPATDTARASGRLEMSAHPVTRNLEGGIVVAPGTVRGNAPQGWTPVARAGGKVAVAVREAPARQVWVGFDSPDWPRLPEYVVFWTNVFDWLGGTGGPEFRGYPVAPLDGAWRPVAGTRDGTEPGLWPGLYERPEDGARRGLNALDVQFPATVPTSDWRRQLAAALSRRGGGFELAPLLLVTAVTCLAGVALFWRTNRRQSGAAANFPPPAHMQTPSRQGRQGRKRGELSHR